MIQNKPGCQPNTEWDGCIQETTQLPELSGLRGKITLLTGNRETISLLLVSLAGKLEAISKVLFIDAANCFNPYVLKKIHRRHLLLKVLGNILVSRPFTAYQLKELAAELKDNVIETNAKVLIISPFDALLEEVGKEEQPYLMNFLMDEIKAVTRRFGVITVIGSTRRKIAGDNDSADNLPIALPPSLEGKVDQRFGV